MQQMLVARCSCATSTNSLFHEVLCEVFVSANIPFHKLSHNVLRHSTKIETVTNFQLITNGEWRRLHNEELHSLYRSPNIIRVIKSRRLKWAGHVARIEEGMSAFKILTGKPTGTRPLGRPKRRWEYGPSRDRYQCGELY